MTAVQCGGRIQSMRTEEEKGFDILKGMEHELNVQAKMRAKHLWMQKRERQQEINAVWDDYARDYYRDLDQEVYGDTFEFDFQ